jgi:hypothetical protein
MRVFVTGATGFIGSAMVRELIDAAGAKSLIDADAQVHRGGSALAGSDRPLVVTSWTALVAPGRLATEENVPIPGATSYPRVSEETAASAAAGGVRASVVRLPQVHDRVKQGLEKGSAGARYHAVAEEGVALREIAEAIGRGLKVPVKRAPSKPEEYI